MRRRPTTASTDSAARVRDYLSAMPLATRRALRQMRETIRDVAPDAVEHFGYGIPGFRLDDRVFVYYAGWKEHVSLYPITANIRRAFAKPLAGFETSKGTVRFSLAKPLPIALVTRLVKARVAEVRKLRKS